MIISFSQSPFKNQALANRNDQLRQIDQRCLRSESTRSLSNKWTKTKYQDYLHCIANFCRAFLNIFSKQFISSNTKRRKWMYETLESFGEMKLMMKFCLCFHNTSELWNLFSLIPVRNCFRCYFRQLFMYLALRTFKNDCKILKITLVRIFVH